MLDTGAPVGDAMVRRRRASTRRCRPDRRWAARSWSTRIKAEVAARLTARRAAADGADRRRAGRRRARDGALRVRLRRARAPPGAAVCGRGSAAARGRLRVMKPRPLRTTVIGSYPFPGWLEFASSISTDFGPDDVAEMQDDAVIARRARPGGGRARRRSPTASRRGSTSTSRSTATSRASSSRARRRGASARPAHDQRGRHAVIGELARAARPRRRRGVRAAAAAVARTRRRRDAEGECARAVHAERPAACRTAVPRPLGADRGAAADRARASSRRSSRPAAARSASTSRR